MYIEIIHYHVTRHNVHMQRKFMSEVAFTIAQMITAKRILCNFNSTTNQKLIWFTPSFAFHLDFPRGVFKSIGDTSLYDDVTSGETFLFPETPHCCPYPPSLQSNLKKSDISRTVHIFL